MEREDFQLHSQDLVYRGEVIPSNKYLKQDMVIKTLLEEIEQLEQFIRNGVEYGYIFVPEIECDSAKYIVKRILSK